MVRRYMLDTNALSDMVKNPAGRVATRVAQVEDEEHAKVCISIIVASEARFGIEKRGSRDLSQQVRDVLRVMEILPLESGVDQHYARVRADLERAGQTISANDYFIAAHALSTDSVLVTNNVREFSRVKGLKYENWLADPSKAE